MGVVEKGNTTAPFRGPRASDGTAGAVRTVTATWHGRYDALVAAKPAFNLQPATGNILAGLPEGLWVISAKVDREEGGWGTMTVVLDNAQAVVGGSGETPVPTLLRTTREKSWVPNSRPLGDHPAMAGYSAGDWAAWLAETDPELKAAFQWTKKKAGPRNEPPADIGTLGGTQQTFAAKVLRGVDSWTDYYMVARQTDLYDIEPATEGCGRGHVGAPAGFTLPSGMSWLKTSDSSAQNGDKTWNRVREWTGILGDWDADIYGA